MAQDSVNTPDPHATPNTNVLRNQGGEHGALAKWDQGNVSINKAQIIKIFIFFEKILRHSVH